MNEFYEVVTCDKLWRALWIGRHDSTRQWVRIRCRPTSTAVSCQIDKTKVFFYFLATSQDGLHNVGRRPKVRHSFFPLFFSEGFPKSGSNTNQIQTPQPLTLMQTQFLTLTQAKVLFLNISQTPNLTQNPPLNPKPTPNPRSDPYFGNTTFFSHYYNFPSHPLYVVYLLMIHLISSPTLIFHLSFVKMYRVLCDISFVWRCAYWYGCVYGILYCCYGLAPR